MLSLYCTSTVSKDTVAPLLASPQTSSASKDEPSRVWDWFCFYQCTETLTSCVSASAMKRHCEYLYLIYFFVSPARLSQSQNYVSFLSIVMVWAIFAPRYMFAAIFTVMGLMFWLVDALLLFTHRDGYTKTKFKGMGKD